MKKEKGENVQVRPSLRTWLKITAARNEVTIVDALSALLEEYQENDQKTTIVIEKWKDRNERL